MIKTILRRGHPLETTEDTPLYASELGLFMGGSRATVYRHIQEGYRLEYGRTTTPEHYRRWLRDRAASQAIQELQKSKENKQRLERELSELRGPLGWQF